MFPGGGGLNVSDTVEANIKGEGTKLVICRSATGMTYIGQDVRSCWGGTMRLWVDLWTGG